MQINRSLTLKPHTIHRSIPIGCFGSRATWRKAYTNSLLARRM